MTHAEDQTASNVITNATAYKVDSVGSWSNALAIRWDRIVALGQEAVGALVGPQTAVTDTQGDLVLPGFLQTRT